MAQEARKKQADAPVKNPKDIKGFDELIGVCRSSDLSGGYEVDQPNDSFISISDGNTTLIYFNSDLWKDKVKFKPFLERINEPNLCLVCTGYEEELTSIIHEAQNTQLQTLCFPLNNMQLNLQTHNFFHLQGLILESEKNHAYVKETNESVKYVLRISRELNGVRDTNKLLSLILSKAREITNADAGSIYVVEWEDSTSREGSICFKITQNESVYQDLSEFRIPISEGSIVGNAVIHETAINIPDLYQLSPNPEENPYGAKHDRTWDQKIGYQCRSMLTIPMFDISHRVIGVIQLINCKEKGIPKLAGESDFNSKVRVFDETAVEYAEIVAQQAGIALENALLTEEKEDLFDGFVHAAVTAIEQRDPTTSGHSHRVAKLTVDLATILEKVDTGTYKDVSFTENQLKEIEYASLLHDFGKLGVREQVLVKAKKLYPWELKLLRERFGHIKARLEVEFLEETLTYIREPNNFPPGIGRNGNGRRLERDCAVGSPAWRCRANGRLDPLVPAYDVLLLAQLAAAEELASNALAVPEHATASAVPPCAELR